MQASESKVVKAIHLGSSDYLGGASRAMVRIHDAVASIQDESQIHSIVYVISKQGNNNSVHVLPESKGSGLVGCRSAIRRVSQFLFYRRLSKLQTGNHVFHSFAAFPRYRVAQLNSLSGDLFNLHWLGGEIASIEELGRLNKPIVWTLHDQWAFCGAEHYTSLPPENDRRFIDGYIPSNRPRNESGPDINREIWSRKISAWRRPMHIVCPSRWLADCAAASLLMRDWPIRVIPNPIDTELWLPIRREQACNALNLDPHKRYLIFGACGGTTDPRKGGDLLLESLCKLRSLFEDQTALQTELIVFGETSPVGGNPFPFRTHYFGNIDSDQQLVSLYSTADLMLIPSRQDNLPNTGLESHACGVPVIAYDVGGLSDIVDNGHTGILAQAFDTIDYAHSIFKVLTNRSCLEYMRICARERAVRLWNPRTVAESYASLYRDVLTK